MVRLRAFVAESNRIEGITRDPKDYEIEVHELFLAEQQITVSALEAFFHVGATGAGLRNRPGLNVRVGNHRPRPGGPWIKFNLEALLGDIEIGRFTPYQAHQRYEHLHPFTDGNGRSGRALWAWHMRRTGENPFVLPFLHRWYYQSLEADR